MASTQPEVRTSAIACTYPQVPSSLEPPEGNAYGLSKSTVKSVNN